MPILSQLNLIHKLPFHFYDIHYPPIQAWVFHFASTPQVSKPDICVHFSSRYGWICISLQLQLYTVHTLKIKARAPVTFWWISTNYRPSGVGREKPNFSHLSRQTPFAINASLLNDLWTKQKFNFQSCKCIKLTYTSELKMCTLVCSILLNVSVRVRRNHFRKNTDNSPWPQAVERGLTWQENGRRMWQWRMD